MQATATEQLRARCLSKVQRNTRSYEEFSLSKAQRSVAGKLRSSKAELFLSPGPDKTTNTTPREKQAPPLDSRRGCFKNTMDGKGARNALLYPTPGDEKLPHMTGDTPQSKQATGADSKPAPDIAVG